MKCNCGKDFQVEMIRCEKGCIALAYKRLACRCGNVSKWCDTYFNDWYEWCCNNIKATVKA